MNQPLTAPASISAEQRTALALRRIEASRSQLILTLAPTSPKRSGKRAPQAPSGSASKTPPNAPFSETLAARMEQQGVGQGTWQALSGAATDWLGSQPWYASVELVGSTLVHHAKPVVRRHPWICLGAAAATGAALVALRPWGWQPVQHRVAPWRSQVGSMVWGQLTQAPVQMALAGALAAWLSGNSNPSARNPAPVKPGPPPPPMPSDPQAPSSTLEGSNRPASSPGVMPAAAGDMP